MTTRSLAISAFTSVSASFEEDAVVVGVIGGMAEEASGLVVVAEEEEEVNALRKLKQDKVGPEEENNKVDGDDDEVNKC